MKKLLVILFIPFILLGGCTSEEEKTTPDQSGNEQIFSAQTGALEKAKQVDHLIQSGVDERHQAIEKQSQ